MELEMEIVPDGDGRWPKALALRHEWVLSCKSPSQAHTPGFTESGDVPTCKVHDKVDSVIAMIEPWAATIPSEVGQRSSNGIGPDTTSPQLCLDCTQKAGNPAWGRWVPASWC